MSICVFIDSFHECRIYLFLHINVYIYRERERERDAVPSCALFCKLPACCVSFEATSPCSLALVNVELFPALASGSQVGSSLMLAGVILEAFSCLRRWGFS